MDYSRFTNGEQRYFSYLKDLTVEQFQGLLNNSLKSFLKEMKTEIEIEASQKAEESKLVDMKKLMEVLQITKPTIYKWMRLELINSHKIGGKRLFDLPVILADIKKNNYKFGRGRDYLYKTTGERNQQTKEDRRFYNINWKIMAKKPITSEEERFHKEYQERHPSRL